MNRFDGLLRWGWSVLVVCTLAFALGGCEGDDGTDGATGAVGPAGAAGPAGPDGPPGPVPDAITAAIDSAQVESCATCHGGVGDEHQAVYNQYADESRLGLEITNVQSTDIGGSPSLDTTSFYFAEYDIGNDEFVNSAGGFAFSLSAGNAESNGDGSYTLTQTVSVDTDAFTSGALVGRIADGQLDIEERQGGKRVKMYADNSSDHWEFGDVNAFESVANAEGCEACHGAPYFKHGNYPGQVAGTPDFTICKSCHNSTSAGGHPEWQYMLDSPLAWATDTAMTPEEEALYAYDRTLVNDVHMSHAMEFPYPQSMATCATCHAGNVDEVLADENFTAETCWSCHAVRGIDSWPELVDAATGEVIQEEGEYYQSHRPPPMAYIWTNAGVEGFAFHNPTEDCTNCHKDPLDGGFASLFTDLHTGYDATIYDDTGARYANLYTVSIDSVSMAGDLMTIEFSGDATIIPELLVSFYGWDTKHFIVGSHERDGTDLCPGSHGDGCKMEYVPESSGGGANPLFTEDAASAAGAWIVTLDMSALQLTKTDLLPALIANGDITKAEISINPELEIGGVDVVLEAVSDTFDLGTNAIIDEYFAGDNATVDIDKCNACHDVLASTFHAGSGRGGDGMQVCKACHTTTFPGSHLEMASRSIDSYVHAIHTFQPFDLGSVDAANPVEVKRTEMHEEHTFPYFTAQACEGCHVAGTYNVPDQSQSMPGLLAASDTIADRNIGSVPEAVTGPASRACGGCHRAELINEDKAGELASFNAHTDAFGTFVENDDDDLVLFGIIDKIMTWFE